MRGEPDQGDSGVPLTMPVRLIASLCDRLSAGVAPHEAWNAIGVATAALFGPGLLTINANVLATGEVVRLWSSNLTYYPIGGRKFKGDSAWAQQVLHRGEVFIGEGDGALAQVFDDIATIRTLGLTAVVNVPLCERGRCVGTFNFLAARSAWSDREIAALRLLAQLAVPAVLATKAE
jgi:hypothetical protein